MNQKIRFSMIAAFASASLAFFASAAEPSPANAPDDKEPMTRKEIRIRHFPGGPAQLERVTFLGVETEPVSATLASQLGLADGTGLAVLQIVPDSPAASALKEHDVLLKVDDQLLVDEHQLSVLIRNHKEGDEISLTYLRAGKPAVAKVRLAVHDAPKVSETMRILTHRIAGPGGGSDSISSAFGSPGSREDADRVLSLLKGAREGGGARLRIDGGDGTIRHITRVNPDIGTLVVSDDHGSLELRVQDGKKTLTAKNQQGATEFSGPVTSPEERKALAPELRERLEKLEAMQGVSFRTDDGFGGADVQILSSDGSVHRSDARVD